jgi:hypothetical protein
MCFDSGKSNFFNRVYAVSALPLCAAAFIGVAYVLRTVINPANCRSKVASQHVLALLLLSYSVLPTCSMIQFQGLECKTLQKPDSLSFLHADGSVDCTSSSYLRFRAVDLLFVAIYQSVPLLWFVMLFKQRSKLNPSCAGILGDFETAVIEARKDDVDLERLNFLWWDYRPSRWYYEVLEI